eukprot:scaffold45424_cov21-Tisochrysis_lutea.AAC.3
MSSRSLTVPSRVASCQKEGPPIKQNRVATFNSRLQAAVQATVWLVLGCCCSGHCLAGSVRGLQWQAVCVWGRLVHELGL